MKKLVTLLLIMASSFSYSQDTTALRWVSVNENGILNFFKNDTTDLTSITSGYGTGQGIFMSNKDSLLYGIFSNGSSSGDRNLYSINPFTGTFTLVRDLATNYISSADITEDGNTLYIIEGNAASGIGKVSSVDLATGTETVLTTALNDGAGSSSYGIEFNPTDTSLYVFEGSYTGNDRVQAINLNTLVNTNSPMVGWSTQLHGAKWTGTGNKFIVCAGYGCDMLMTDATANNLVSFYSNCGNHSADVEEFKTLRAKSKVIHICPNTTDSAMISLIYGGTNFSWYKNGVLLSETNDTLMAFDAGVYRALIQIDTTYMWSETIQIIHDAVPVVTITQATNDILICPAETILLNGVSGGTLKWYKNGTPIVGATGSTYSATTAGAYNQMKTNTSGCKDSSSVSYVITDQLTGCTASINNYQTESNITLYPNPVTDALTIESSETINSIIVYDIVGREVSHYEEVKRSNMKIDMSELVNGSYLVKIITENGQVIKKIQK